ncbi:MAG: SulP family inorganic anion transporter, partial [Desulfobacteraceae bacterium]|nr:SulP family inorganic anion transporter [Desulfobacteraceae bacterium]
AALIIASSQLSKMFGVYVDKGEHHYETIIRVVQAAFHYTHWPTLIMGAFAFVIMYGLRRISPKIPNVLVAVALTTIISWAIGFQHNATVDISTIESLKPKRLIEQFSSAVNMLSRFEEERTEVNKTLDAANSGHDIVGVLDAEHDANVLEINIKRLKSDMNNLRTELRGLLFEGVRLSDGSLRLYPKDEMPARADGDGRTWRIKVGNKPLQTDRLLMTSGGAVVGSIPRGLPSLTIPEINLKVILHMFPFAAIISLLGFMEAISIAKAMAAKTGQRIDPNQELIGQGLANICGAIGKSYPTSGSFSRSAVNLQAGAVSGLSSVFTSLAVVIVLLFFTPLLYHLPQSVLAAVIMMAVLGLINISGFIHAWKAQWYDGAIAIISFICTLVFAPHLDKGIIIGVILSLFVFLYKSMRPSVATLSRAEDHALRDCTQHGLKECEYISMVRFDGPLFFANASYLEDQIMDLMLNKKDLKHIVIVSNGINDIDASGEEVLSLLVDRVRSAGIDISLTGVNESVMKVFRRTHFPEKIGEDHIYSTMEKAIGAIYKETHMDGREETCPLITVCHLA